MDAPPVQYVTTSDGYRIAYCVAGHGVPVVQTPWPWSHSVLFWQPHSVVRRWLEALAERVQLIHYDSRGQGMSTRGLPVDHSMEAYERDLEAVVERCQLSRFVLLGLASPYGHIAMSYAAKHPERVEALVLWNCRVDGAGGPVYLLEELARQDWEAYLDMATRTTTSEDVGFAKRLYAESSTQADFLAMLKVGRLSSVASVAPLIHVPTLLMAVQGSFGTEEANKFLASQISDSRLLLFDEASTGVYAPAGATPAGVLAIESFVIEVTTRKNPTEGGKDHRVVPDRLSAREIEVLRLIAVGHSNQQIAVELVISTNTVGRHVGNIFNKIGVANRAAAASYAHRKGLV